MREIEASSITSAVKQLFIKANYHLPSDVKNALLLAKQNETDRKSVGRERVC